MATYLNDLRLTELATGEGSGTWGTTTNLSLELIGEALGFATQQVFGSDADATTTIADGASDPARAMYFKITSAGSLTATRTCTIAPNTVSRVMFIENATTGSQSIAISQGSGASVTILAGKTAVVYLDGAGAGAAVVDAMAGVDPGVTDTLAEVLAAGNTSGANNLIIDNGQAITTNTINETTAASGVTIDSVLLKDDGVNATNLEITNLKANDGTSAGSIADSTGVVTLASLVATTADINAGTIDNTVIGGTTAAAGSFTTGSFSETTFVGLTARPAGVPATAGRLWAAQDETGNYGIASKASTTDSFTYIGNTGTKATLGQSYGSTGSYLPLVLQTSDLDRLTISAAGAATFSSTVAGAFNGTLGATTPASVAATTLSTTGAATFGGNVAIGLASTNTWSTGYAIEIGTEQAAIWGAGDQIDITGNAYFNSGWKAAATKSGASKYEQALGTHNFAVSGAVTADSAITFKSALNIAPNGDISFYEDTGTTAKFFWDASAESLGIGTSSPTYKLNVLSDAGAQNIFQAGQSGVSNGLSITSDGTNLTYSFLTGNVGIGLSSPSTKGHFYSATSMDQLTVDGTGAIETGINFANGGTTYGQIYFNNVSPYDMSVLQQYSTGSLILGTNDTERMRIDSSGGLITNPAAGGHAVFNEGGVDADFRVESDGNANMLFVNGGSNRVGIGRDPQDNGSTLQVAADATASTDLQLTLRGLSNENKKLVLGFDTTANIASITSLEAGVDYRPLHLQGIEFVWNEAGANHDFRVESDTNTHALFVDAGNSYVNLNSSATPDSSVAGFMFTADQLYTSAGAATTLNYQVRFYNGNGLVGAITTDGSATAYLTSSDQRLKENIADAPDAGDLIDAILRHGGSRAKCSCT
jgi:hypothetical protein